jgi:hypothetical protein
MRDLHELQLWFSNIGEVEREISMRTESGFYYSFYKHLVKASSFSEALNALRDDERYRIPIFLDDGIP